LTDDFVIEVRGALPDEQVRIAYDHRGKARVDGRRRAYGHVVEVLHPHPGRREAPCTRCAGCPLMIADEPAQRELKRAWLRDEHGIEVDEVIGGAALGYRWSSKRVAAMHDERLVLGSYAFGTHDVRNMRGCLVDHPDLLACFDEIADRASELGLQAYDESAETGTLRYVWGKTNGQGEVLITLVSGSEDESDSIEALASRLTRPSGVAWSVQPSRGNTLRGSAPVTLKGAADIKVTLAGVERSVGPLGFLQPNPSVASRAYEDLCTAHDGTRLEGSLALDLYAGAGITAQLLATRFARVIPSESYPESAAALGIEPEPVATFLERAVRNREAPELVLANPPRAGMGEEVCRALAELRPAHLHIMSCHPATLAQDLKRLDSVFQLQGARAYDTLPQTAHIEVCAWLTRR